MATDRRALAVDVSILASVPFTSERIQEIATIFLKKLGFRKAVLSIVFVKDAAMRRLNRTSLGHDYVTDIITFDLSDIKSDVLEGELVISPAEAKRNAHLCREPYEREVFRYVAHGLLHLKGYDDATDKERARMRKKEDRLLELIV
jgi:rRNA maturation RNase YbeY